MNHRTSLAMLRALIAGSLGGMILAMLCGCTTTKQYTRLAASASNATVGVSIDGDFHYPVDRFGSAFDASP